MTARLLVGADREEHVSWQAALL